MHVSIARLLLLKDDVGSRSAGSTLLLSVPRNSPGDCADAFAEFFLDKRSLKADSLSFLLVDLRNPPILETYA